MGNTKRDVSILNVIAILFGIRVKPALSCLQISLDDIQRGKVQTSGFISIEVVLEQCCFKQGDIFDPLHVVPGEDTIFGDIQNLPGRIFVAIPSVDMLHSKREAQISVLLDRDCGGRV